MKKLLLTLIGFLFISNIDAQVITGFSNVTDTDGNTHSLSTYLNDGKFVVLNFYLLTCGNCIATAPMIESIYQNYGQNQCNVVVLSFVIDSQSPFPTNVDCDNWALTYGNPSPPNFNYTEASWYQFYSAYGGSFAQTYVVTPNGNSVIYAHAGGVLNQSALESVLNNELANSSASTTIDMQEHCNSYTWIDGVTYTASNNTATHMLSTVNGCDSLIALDLTINSNTSNSTTQTSCDSYTWNGNTYTTSGTYTYISTNASGCDHTETLNLSIEQSTSSYDTLSDTASIIWNGMSLNVSGDYSVILTNSVGCDSIVYLNLTIINTTGISDIANNKSNLVKITDMLGQERPYRKNTPLFYIYDDGTVEKRIIID
jgi:thiol-disulfide isomerase/thioredoxin